MWIVWAGIAAGAPCGAEVTDGRVPAAEAQLAFASREADPVPEAEGAVTAVACLLAADPALTVQVEVHTDARGADPYNLKLSQDRADAVRAALIAAGADAARVTAVGYGERYPLDSNQAAAGRAANRRVELHTASPADRPPRPEPPATPAEPSPAPQPAPLDLCAAARTLRPDQVPSWPSGRCAADGDAWSCTGPQPFAEVADQLAGCFDVQRDGEEVWVQVQGTSMRFAAHPDGTSITPR